MPLPAGTYYSQYTSALLVPSLLHGYLSYPSQARFFPGIYTSNDVYRGCFWFIEYSNSVFINKLTLQELRALLQKQGKQNDYYDYLNGVKVHIRG